MHPQTIFLSLFIVAGNYMKSLDEKDAICRVCMDTDCCFSCRCDYWQHNVREPEVSKTFAQLLWSIWLFLKESPSLITVQLEDENKSDPGCLVGYIFFYESQERISDSFSPFMNYTMTFLSMPLKMSLM